ncbi:class F sortase [Streptomyces sp. BF23-18]|uniref:class F sortase n=1 Tax=Streptomyces sp. BF23-18 TaxID=3240282 RepID=UPI0034E5637D
MVPEETRTPTRPPAIGRSTVSTAPETPLPRAWTVRLMVAGILLAALNLRPAITSLGALLEEVRDGLGMSGGAAGLLTSVPPLCFAVFGVTAPRLARRFGPAAVVCAGMVAITTGLVVRPYIGGTAGFLAMSALALMGIAVSNVLMPVIVKRWFPDKVGSMTGLYSMALALGTSAAAAATVPMTDALGGDWRSGLVVWAGLAAAAVLPWVLLVRARGAGPGTGDREPAASDTARPAPPPAPLPRSRAVRLRIASLGVDAPVIGLRLDRQRRLAAPPVDDPKPVGWYTDGPTPGERGTALVVGHRDTRTGPAVFAPLERIRPGARVEARRVDGRTAVYTVDVVRTYAKAQFPDKEVYGNRGRPELRLITCGGAYDHRTGYAANVIAFAHLTQILGRAGAR